MFPLVFFVIRLKVGEGIGLRCNPQLGIINVRIYLRRVQIIMCIIILLIIIVFI